jgi:RNA polymerase sigma-70 factor (ECF subfamily)
MQLAPTELITHLPYLRRYGLRMTGSADAAEELVQETMEKALRGLPNYQPTGSLQGWLITIMRNQFMTRYRAEQRLLARTANAELSSVPVPPSQFDACLLHELARAVRRLPRGQRDVLVAVCVEGYSYDQASASLEIPIGTVRSRLARARSALHELSQPSGRRRHGRTLRLHASAAAARRRRRSTAG